MSSLVPVELLERKELGSTLPAAAEEVSDEVAEHVMRLLEQMRAVDSRYNAIFENASDGIALIDEQGIILHVNRRMSAINGRPREELIGKHFSTFSPPGHELENELGFANTLKGSAAPVAAIARPDGEVVFVQFSNSVICIEGETQVLCIGRDVTREVKDARQLAESEEKYRRLVENLADVAFSTRLSDGKLLVMSPNVLALTGYAVKDIAEGGWQFWESRIHPEDRARLSRGRAKLNQGDSVDEEYRFKHRDGSWRWLRTHARSNQYGMVHSIDGIISDISARKRLEDELRQSQKMEALGRFTGGVAHDFNNLLCVMLTNTELLMRAIPRDDPRYEDAANVREAGERAANLTRQLLAFSRKQVLAPRPLDLNTLVQGVDKLLRRVIGEDVTLELSTEAETSWVRADVGQLEQLLMNLAVNARDAMPAGGTLNLEVRNVTLAEGEVERLPGGKYVRLSVRDTGCGMDEATQSRLFEPFFTTKEVGKGTGLGLSTCYGIVHQSQGHIGVVSALRQGTTFVVHLPRAGEEVAPRAKAPVRAANGGAETVLIVEDEESLRRTLGRMLERMGYRVLAARDGDEAQALFEAHAREVTLVLSDVVMPGKSGPETVQQLRAAAFTGKVLFMSGYADRPELQPLLADPNQRFIQKPFQREALARTVREVLDGGES
ncbi:MAG: PAS domain S-box protein [Archangiaceae bacterium]|nr:PAS domain S-box protein [Archangiaceae bacterium]